MLLQSQPATLLDSTRIAKHAPLFSKLLPLALFVRKGHGAVREGHVGGGSGSAGVANAERLNGFISLLSAIERYPMPSVEDI